MSVQFACLFKASGFGVTQPEANKSYHLLTTYVLFLCHLSRCFTIVTSLMVLNKFFSSHLTEEKTEAQKV